MKQRTLALTLILGFGVVVAISAPASSRADAAAEHADTAAQLFRAAAAAHARGDYPAAAEAFEEANRHAPRGATLLNAALSWEAAGNKPRAANAYAQALALGGLGDAQSETMRKRLDELRGALALLQLRGPPRLSASVAHIRNAPLPVDVFVPPGSIEVRVTRADGTAVAQTIAVGAGESRTLAFEAAPAAPPPVRATGGADATTTGSARTGSAQRTLSFVTFGLAGAGAVTAAIFGLEALQAKNAYATSGNTDCHAYDEAYAFRTTTNVAWVTTGVLAATGLILLLTAPKRSAAADRATRGDPSVGHLALTW